MATERVITAYRQGINTDLITEAAEATMGPLWIGPADLYAAARQCARYGRTRDERVTLLAMCGLVNHDRPVRVPKGCGPGAKEASAVAAAGEDGTTAGKAQRGDVAG